MKRSHGLIIGAVVLVLGGILASPALAADDWELSPSSMGEAIATVNVQPGVVTLSPNVSFERVRLVVSGPEGIVFNKVYTEAPIVWRVEDSAGKLLADGRYNFELRFDVGQKQSRPIDMGEAPQAENVEPNKPHVVSGSFSVVGGVVNTAYQSSVPSRSISRLREPMEPPTTKAYDYDFLFVSSKIGIGIDNSAILPASALEIQEQSPTGILLEDRVGGYGTDLEGQWRIRGTSTNFTIGHDPTPNASGDERENFVIEEGGKANAFYLDSTGAIGLGTSTPFGSLEIDDQDFFTQITLTANGGMDYVGSIQSRNDNRLFTIEGATEQDIMNIHIDGPANALNIGSTGNVGIGTISPEQALDVLSGAFGGIRAADASTNNTTKRFRLYSRHYSNAQPGILLFSSVSNGTVNTADFGGGAAGYNAATDVRFWTASSPTATGGTIRMVVNGSGNVGIGTTSPTYPLHMGSGAHVTAGGVWTNASSRDYKENIATLSSDAARTTVMGLEPVTYDYKNTGGEHHVGFIAEDVPDLVATPDRKGMSAMDVVAVLTKVVQEQQKTIDELSSRLAALEGK